MSSRPSSPKVPGTFAEVTRGMAKKQHNANADFPFAPVPLSGLIKPNYRNKSQRWKPIDVTALEDEEGPRATYAEKIKLTDSRKTPQPLEELSAMAHHSPKSNSQLGSPSKRRRHQRRNSSNPGNKQALGLKPGQGLQEIDINKSRDLVSQPATDPVDEINEVFQSRLPDPIFLQENVGSRNGEIVFIQHPNRDVSAHQWSSSSFQWSNIGQFSASRRRIEGQLATERLPVDSNIPYNTLAYFREASKQREAAELANVESAGSVFEFPKTTMATLHQQMPQTMQTNKAVVPKLPKPVHNRHESITTAVPLFLPKSDPKKSKVNLPQPVQLAQAVPTQIRKVSPGFEFADSIKKPTGKLDFNFKFPMQAENQSDDEVEFLYEENTGPLNKQGGLPGIRQTLNLPGSHLQGPRLQGPQLGQGINIDGGEPNLRSSLTSPIGGSPGPRQLSPMSTTSVRSQDLLARRAQMREYLLQLGNDAATMGSAARPLRRGGNWSGSRIASPVAGLEGQSTPDLTLPTAAYGHGQLPALGAQRAAPRQPSLLPRMFGHSNRAAVNQSPIGEGPLDQTIIDQIQWSHADYHNLKVPKAHSKRASASSSAFDPNISIPDNNQPMASREIVTREDGQLPTIQNFRGPFFSDSRPSTFAPATPLAHHMSKDQELGGWWSSGQRDERQKDFLAALVAASSEPNRDLSGTNNRLYLSLYETLNTYISDPYRGPIARFGQPPKHAIETGENGNMSFFDHGLGVKKPTVGAGTKATDGASSKATGDAGTKPTGGANTPTLRGAAAPFNMSWQWANQYDQSQQDQHRSPFFK